MADLAPTLIDLTRKRLVADFPRRIAACLDALSDEEIWWRPNPASNSIGNLVLHLCGSTRHFLGRGVGGSEYNRDRPAEFAERGPIPKADLKRLLEEVAAESDRILGSLTAEGLTLTTDRLDKPFGVTYLLLRVSHHWAEHTGQIVYVAKTLKEGAIRELYRRTAP
jgi:uncharacterized damage-inducible protein DinB